MTGDFTELRRVPLFAGCTDRELADVHEIVDEVDVEPGEVIVEQGHNGGRSFVILDGTARANEVGADLGPGIIFGEMAVLDGGPRFATVVAETPMRLAVVDGPALVRLLDVGGIARRVARTAVDRLRSSAG
jgi:CRP-like cAMP-binding protein